MNDWYMAAPLANILSGPDTLTPGFFIFPKTPVSRRMGERIGRLVGFNDIQEEPFGKGPA
jgi:hypothetical protein